MKQNFRKSMLWLHTYSGLFGGWLIFTIWVTGTLSYFNPEISLWMKPELTYSHNKTNLIDQSLEKLHQKGQQANRWQVVLPSSRDNNWRIEWRVDKERNSLNLHPDTGRVLAPRATKGGGFFRTFHYTLHLRSYGGRFLSGIAAMTFLIAIFTGIYAHRRFFKDFFSLRSGKLMTLLRDFHALAGIITMPINIVLCISALFIYVFMYMPASAEYHFDGGERAVFKKIIPSLPPLAEEATPAQPIHSFKKIQTQLDQVWSQENQLAKITFEQPYQSNGRIIVERTKDKTLSNRATRLVFSAITGESLEGYPDSSNAAKVRRVFWGLHEAKFAPPLLRWLLFFLGVISSAMIATGLIYWLKIRCPEGQSLSRSHKLVARLNVAVIAGLILAIGAYFIANRLIPIDAHQRADLETQVFLITWLLAVVHSFIRKTTVVWKEQLSAAAVVYLSVFFLDITLESHYLIQAFKQANWPYISFSISILTTATLLFFAAARVSKDT